MSTSGLSGEAQVCGQRQRLRFRKLCHQLRVLMQGLRGGESACDSVQCKQQEGADNLGVSGRGRETFKDLRLFTEDEQVVSEATERADVQQQEQEQVLRELQILRTLLQKPVTVFIQLVLALSELLGRPEATRQRGQSELQRKLLQIQR